MSLPKKLTREIEHLLKGTIKNKLLSYKSETEHKPFHHRLIGRDRYAIFSFIHSINTTFGMSIFEQMGEMIAKNYGCQAKRNYKLRGQVDEKTERLINLLHSDLRQGKRKPNITETTKIIRNSIKLMDPVDDPDKTVDLFIKKKAQENYFDITSAKPNIKEFSALKRKLLRWKALRLSQNKSIDVFPRLGIPYNPYFPEPYERWTLRGLYDLDKGEILIGKDFWNFLAGQNIYNDLLSSMKKIGDSLRPELDKFFRKLK